MAGSVKLLTPAGGSVTINAGDTASALSITLPATTDTITTNASTQTLTNKTLTNPVINGFTGDTSVVNIGSGQIYKDSSGNVGIGTSSPTTVLTVRKAIDSAAYGSGTNMIDFKSYFPGYDTETVKASIYCGVDSQLPLNTQSGYFVIKTALAGTLYERMRIDSSGKVGIGTTSPQFFVSANQNNANVASSVQVTPQFYAKGYAGAAQQYAGIGFAMYEHTNGYWGSGILAFDDTGSYGSALTFYTSTGSSTPTPTERMRIDSSGRVTKPYQTSFSAYSTDGTNISGANIKLTMYTGVSFNVGNNYNSTTCRYTAPINGVYFFRAQAWAPPGNTLSALSIRVNGAQKSAHRWSAATAVTAQYNTLVPTLVIKLTAGDYVELYTSVDGGIIHPSTGEQYSNFSGYLLG